MQRGNSKQTTHSHSNPPSPECSRTYTGKRKKGLDKRGNKRSGMVLYVLQKHFTEIYKKMYEIWTQSNPESRMYMEAKKLMNQKNYIMKHNKITEMEIE